MIKIKSISKRVLAVILATMMLLTSGIVGTLAANVDFAETRANITNISSCHLVGSHQGWSINDSAKLSTTDYNTYTGTFFVPYQQNNYEIKYVINGNQWRSIGGYWYTKDSYEFIKNMSDAANDQVQNITSGTGYIRWDVTFRGKHDNDSYSRIQQTAVTALGGSVVTETTLYSGETVTITPKGTGGSGSYSFSYSKTGGTLSKTTGASTVFTAPTVTKETTYTVTTTIKDAHSQLSDLTAKKLTTTITVKPATPAQPTVNKTLVSGVTAITGDGTTTKPYRIPVGTEFNVELTASAANATQYIWNGTVGGATHKFTEKAADTPGPGQLTYTVKAKNNAGESAATTKTIYVEYYDYYCAGDKVYFECANKPNVTTGYGAAVWEDYGTTLTTFINLSGSQDDSDLANSVEVTKLGKYLYQYTFNSDDAAKYIESINFLRVNNNKGHYERQCYTNTSLKASDLHATDSKNAIVLTTLQSGTPQPSTVGKITELGLSTTLNVTEPVVVGQSTTVSTGDIVLNYKRDDAAVTTPATDINYSYKVGGAEVGTDETYDWTLESTDESVITLDMTLVADSTITGSATKNVTAQPNELNLTIEEVDGTGNILINNTTVKNGDVITVEYNTAYPYEVSVSSGSEIRIASIEIICEDGEKIPVDVDSNDNVVSKLGNLSLTKNAKFKVTYAKKYVKITVNNAEGGKVDYEPAKVMLGGKITVTATPDADNFYVFDKWTVTGAAITDAQSKNPVLVIENISGDLEITPSFKKSDTGFISTSVDYPDRGTVEPAVSNKEITLNTPYTITAYPKTGYKVTGWTVTGGTDGIDYKIIKGEKSATVELLTKGANINVQAHFAGVEGTVNFSASDGGTVNKETVSVTYDSYATATAKANEGSNFVNWTISGKEGSYELVDCTISSKTINIRPLEDGVTINAVANFSKGYSIKAYYLSDNSFYHDLELIEYADSTTSHTVYDAGAVGTESFGGVAWNSAGTVEFKAGYTHDVTAQMSGESPISSTSGTLIMFNDIHGWGNIHCYAGVTWDNVKGAIPKDNTAAYSMTNIKGTSYWYVYVNDLSKFSNILFVNADVHNYNDLNSSHKAAFRGDAIENINKNLVMYYPPNDSNETKHECPYFSDGTWVQAPELNTIGTVHHIKDALYPNGTWCNKDAVWIYDSGNTVNVTFRSNLSNLVKSNTALYQSQNANGYTVESWNAFVAKYDAAKSVLGAGASTQGEIDKAAKDLQDAIDRLTEDPNVTVYATDGTITGQNGYIGKISFTGKNYTASTYKHDDISSSFYTIRLARNTPIEIKCTIQQDGYKCEGFIINGTHFVKAELDPSDATQKTYRASYSFAEGGDVIPVYYKTSIFKADGTLDTTKAIRVYAKYDPDSFTRWGSYIAAYTWTETDGGYTQMGIWPGQLMIPENSQKGVYYTYVERTDASGNAVKGITFDNYGYKDSNNNCALINNLQRVQAYDYYEFVKLADGNYENITFTFKQSPDTNGEQQNSIDIIESNFVDYTNQNGEIMDIQRRTEGLSEDVGLYIVRKGPKGSSSNTQGSAILDGQYYIDCYLYSPTGAYLGSCKSYMLLTPEDVKITVNGTQKTLAEYAGNKLVKVDYEGETGSEVDGNSAYRFDGEWYGYNNDQKVTLNAKVALLSPTDNRTYEYQESNIGDVNGIGSAYVNGKDSVTVEIKEGTARLSATPMDGYMFCGWYIMRDDGSIDVVNPNIEIANTTVNLNFSYTYVALYYPIPEGLLVVNNYCYMIDPNDLPEGESYAQHTPPVQGGKMEYAQRTVKLVVTKTDGTTKTVYDPNEFSANTIVELGDKVDVYIITTPIYPDDYVYAWYEKIYDENGKVNFEEVGPGAALTHTPLKTEEYYFTININSAEDIKTYTIYTDVYHASSDVTLKYVYQNRFGETVSYTVTYGLTAEEYKKNKTPSYEALQDNAPYVDDLYKNVFWKIKSDEYIKDGKVFTITAEQPDTFKVNLIADGVPYTTIEKKFNESISIDAREIDSNITNLQGVWFVDGDKDNLYTENSKDQILAYGSYYGFVVTGDATICYDSQADARKLGYKAILEEAIYGREQSNSADGTSSIDKIYVDYIIRYLVPKFDKDQEPDGTILKDYVNTNATPVRFQTLINADYKVDYGVALEYINTLGPDAGTDAQKKNYTDLYNSNKTDTAILQNLLAKMGETTPTYGGYGNSAKSTYFYIYSAKNQGNEASNKNRLLMTFSFTNNETNCNKYYNVIAYLKLTDKDGNVTYVFSNQGTLNIKDTANKKADDIIYGTINP